MIPYLVLAAFPIVVALGYDAANKNYINAKPQTKKWFMFACFVALFLMFALRSKYVGSADSYNYYNNWNILSSADLGKLLDVIENSKMSWGYLVSVWTISHIFPNPQFVFVFSGFFFSLAVCRFIYKNCEDIVLGVLMYITLGLYIFMAQGLRQSVAMSICLFALEFAKKRKFIPFALLVLLAAQFHVTAIVFFVVYFIYGLSIKTITVILIGIISAVVLFFSERIVNIGNTLFDREYSGTVSSGGFVAFAVYFIIIVVALLLGGEKKNDKNFAFFFYMTVIAAIIFLMRYVGTQAAERISFYFMFAQMPLLCSTLRNLKPSVRQTVTLVVFALSISLFIYRLNGSDLIPFNFFWQGAQK